MPSFKDACGLISCSTLPGKCCADPNSCWEQHIEGDKTYYDSPKKLGWFRRLLLASAMTLASCAAVAEPLQSPSNVREIWDIFQSGVSACYEDGQDTATVSYPWSPMFAKASSWLVHKYAASGRDYQVSPDDWEEWFKAIVLSNSKHIHDAPCMLNWMQRHIGEERA